MVRRPPEQPSDLPPEVSAAIAAVDLDQVGRALAHAALVSAR